MRKIEPGDPETRSLDLVAENLERMRDLFPQAFTEDGIDFSTLRQLLGDAVDEGDERYGMSWSGKRRARRLALTPSRGTLRPCPDESVDWDTTQNLLIEGDNLETLKLLQRSYFRKVKLIYIDPPYNTGRDWIYPDNYKNGVKNYLKLTGQLDGNGQNLTSNPETSGRFHTTWLNMIYPRLMLARNLLRDDGILVASISDSEMHNFRSCLDEIFGSDNMIGCVMWNSTKSVTNTALISVSHTYNLIYARDREHFVKNRHHFRLPEPGDGFSNPDNDPRGPWKADPFQVGGERPNQMYPITNPKTGAVYRPNPGSSWKNELRVFEELMADNRIVFGASGEAGPQRKRFLTEAEDRGRVAKTWWDDVGTTASATRAANDLMGESVFNNPKPTSLIRRFIQLGAHDPDSAIIMDFFAGSGTTALAALEENIADGAKRKYILVQLPEPLDPSKKEQKIAAEYCDRIGKPRNLAELTKEHLWRFKARHMRKVEPSTDLGFRVFKLDTSNIRAWEPDRENLKQSILESQKPIKPDRSEEDILYEVMLKLGKDLRAPVQTRIVVEKRVVAVDDGALIACMSEEIGVDDSERVALEIAEWLETLENTDDVTAVFRDDAFINDVAKLNLAEILRQYGVKDVRSI